ncbi:segregation and condensation protein A [Timonella sp. A28]|uniref:segregation and condensation protein A n=1 Tax=Timonella sp. A28 TaxID=3442640 RepID=UPI003EB78117
MAHTHANTPQTLEPHEGFHVHLENFQGPFDLLLSLIAKRKLDITEIALAEVTDEFISYIQRAQDDPHTGDSLIGGDPRKNLGIASEFLLVAATLLDLKAARLLPTHTLDDEDALELLEARDVLFAKLLQYRAYKELASVFEQRLTTQSAMIPRAVELEPDIAQLLPPLVWTLTPEKLRDIAASVLHPTPVPEPEVRITHLHAPKVTLAQQAPLVIAYVQHHTHITFEELCSEVPDTLHVVVRFLVVLELFRDGLIDFRQENPLGNLHIVWRGNDGDTPVLLDEYTGHAKKNEDAQKTPSHLRRP